MSRSRSRGMAMREVNRLRCTPQEAVALLKTMWDLEETGRYKLSADAAEETSLSYLRDSKPFRSSDNMQWGLTDNPLWDIIEWLPCSSDGLTTLLKPDGHHAGLSRKWMNQLYNLGISRTSLCRTYTFSLISPWDIEWMKKLVGPAGIVEINA